MTGQEFYEWIQVQECDIQPLFEHKAKVLKITKRNTLREAFLPLPINDKPIKDFTICRICSALGISIPSCSSYMKPFHDEVKENENIEEVRFTGKIDKN